MKPIMKDIFSPVILDIMSPTYPRWVKRWSGYHWETDKDCDHCCCDDSCTRLVPDKDAVQYDVWVPFEPTLFSLMPKHPWKPQGWRMQR